MTELKEPKPKSLKWKNIGILISALSIVVLIVALGLAASQWLQMNAKLGQQVSHVENKISSMQNDVTNAQKLTTQFQQITERQLGQQNALEELQKNQITKTDDFRVAEAQYYVKLAHTQLKFGNDTDAALKLLQAANQTLNGLSDSKSTELQKTIASDIDTLQSAPKFDITSLYSRLVSLAAQLNTLPLQSPFSAPEKQVTQVNDLSWWQRTWQSIWQALQRIVVVRKVDNNTLQFIAPDQQALFFQNLHAQIEKAEWALLHGQQQIYNMSLQQAIDWIKKYIVQDSPLTQQILNQLIELQKVNIHPEIQLQTTSP